MKKTILFVVSTTLFVGSFCLIFRNWQSTIIITVLMLLHEFGHWAYLKSIGDQPTLVAIPFLGGVTFSSKKLKLFTTTQRLWLFLSGPLASVFGVALSLGFFLVNPGIGKEALALACLLALTSALPFAPIIDGYRIMEILESNFSEGRIGKTAQAMLVIPILGLISSLILPNSIYGFAKLIVSALAVVWPLVYLFRTLKQQHRFNVQNVVLPRQAALSEFMMLGIIYASSLILFFVL